MPSGRPRWERSFVSGALVGVACSTGHAPMLMTASPAPPASSAASAPVSPVAPPPEGPVPLPFADAARHYRNANAVSDYPRYSPEQHELIAVNILLHQRENGGFRENWDPQRVLGEEERAQVLAQKPLEDTTLDNRTTYTHAEYLAEVWRRSGDERFRSGALRALDFLLGAQHASGCFPHSFPKREGYRGQLTFMDEVTTGALATLKRVAEGRGAFARFDDLSRERARAAVERGNACILRLQQRFGGELSAWAGQYDRDSLEPTTGRSFELPGLVSDESASVVRYLMSLEPQPEVVKAIEGAVRWFERSKLSGIRMVTVTAEPVRYEFHTSTEDRVIVADPNAPPLWARFYEIETNRPFMANRDGKKVYSLAEVARERRTGYRWYGEFGKELLERDYPAWLARTRAK